MTTASRSARLQIMKFARDVYGWPRLETARLHIELCPTWYWSPGPHPDYEEEPFMLHCFLGWLSVTWIREWLMRPRK